MQNGNIRFPLSALAAVSCLTAMLLTGCSQEGKNWDDHTQGLPFVIGCDAGLEQSASENKPAMLFVTTTWCGWCKRLAEESFNDPEIRPLLSRFVCVIVDGDTQQRDLEWLGATEGYPHIIFLSPQGKKLGEQLGYTPPAEFKKVVEDALAANKEASS